MLCQLHASEASLKKTDDLCGARCTTLRLARGGKSGDQQGATIVILPRYELGQFLGSLERHGVTVAPLVPPLVLELSRVREAGPIRPLAAATDHCGGPDRSEGPRRVQSVWVVKFGWVWTDGGKSLSIPACRR